MGCRVVQDYIGFYRDDGNVPNPPRCFGKCQCQTIREQASSDERIDPTRARERPEEGIALPVPRATEGKRLPPVGNDEYRRAGRKAIVQRRPLTGDESGNHEQQQDESVAHG